MIIREIKENPNILENFDWFNDYKDTLSWAKRNCPELVPTLESGFKKFIKKEKMVLNQ